MEIVFLAVVVLVIVLLRKAFREAAGAFNAGVEGAVETARDHMSGSS